MSAKLRTFKIEVPVNYDQAWADAIRQGAPNSNTGSYIWNVEDQFPKEKGTITEKLRFVQFGSSFYHQVVLDYAKEEKIAHIHPRSIFATTEKHPKLADEQDEDYMYLNSGLTCTVGGSVHVPRVRCFRVGFRGARTDDVGREFRSSSWFGFRE